MHNTPSATWLAEQGLRSYAKGLLLRSRSRSYAGVQNTEHRAKLRAWAREAERVADELRDGRVKVCNPFAEREPDPFEGFHA